MTNNGSPAVTARIAQAMLDQQISQRKLGDLVGLSQPHVSKKLRGTARWSADELTRVAEALGIDPAELRPAPAVSR